MMKQRPMRRPWHLQRAGSQTPWMQIPAAVPAADACTISSACLWASTAARSSSSLSIGASFIPPSASTREHVLLLCQSAKWACTVWPCPEWYAQTLVVHLTSCEMHSCCMQHCCSGSAVLFAACKADKACCCYQATCALRTKIWACCPFQSETGKVLALHHVLPG